MWSLTDSESLPPTRTSYFFIDLLTFCISIFRLSSSSLIIGKEKEKEGEYFENL